MFRSYKIGYKSKFIIICVFYDFGCSPGAQTYQRGKMKYRLKTVWELIRMVAISFGFNSTKFDVGIDLYRFPSTWVNSKLEFSCSGSSFTVNKLLKEIDQLNLFPATVLFFDDRCFSGLFHLKLTLLS